MTAVHASPSVVLVALDVVVVVGLAAEVEVLPLVVVTVEGVVVEVDVVVLVVVGAARTDRVRTRTCRPS